jgi:hypothetical protein
MYVQSHNHPFFLSNKKEREREKKAGFFILSSGRSVLTPPAAAATVEIAKRCSPTLSLPLSLKTLLTAVARKKCQTII